MASPSARAPPDAPEGEYQLLRPPASSEPPSSPSRPAEVHPPSRTVLSLTAVAFLLVLACLPPTHASQRGVPGAATPSSAPAGANERALTSLTPAPFVSKCRGGCGNGKCDESAAKCACNAGWRGKDCSLCGGKIKLNSTKGWLADAVGNYTVDSKCTWLIESPLPRAKIRLHLKEFATECGWDHLYVFDGDSVFSDLRAVYSGLVRGDRYSVARVPEIVGTSGSMLLHFYSDVAYNMTGFNVTFSVNTCPSERHDQTCSGNGFCDEDSGQCNCDEDFKGAACSIPACPENCEPRGIARGTCSKSKKQCICYPGWTGEACAQSVSRGFWRQIQSSRSAGDSNFPPPRSSHASVVDEFGTIWVVGGETFERTARHMVLTLTLKSDLVDLSDLGSDVGNDLVWKEVHAKSDKGPSPRYAHSAVIHERKIYMYGGTMRSGHTSKELWALDLDLLSWDRVDTETGQCMVNSDRKLCGPIHSMGHTANVVAKRMIIIFGHSPKYGYLDTVQEYHFGNKEWSIVPTTGYPVKGGFGHSSVFDAITNEIFVYGGYVSSLTPATTSISNEIYSLDPISRRWTRHTSSDSYRYLHSAVASHGYMIVFGGNTHNDTSFSHGAKCFSADLLFYDIVCDRWYNMQDSIPKDIDADLARFGHTAVLKNGTMLIHAGFHGQLKNDLLAYVPGNCQMFKNRVDCLKSKVGVKCVWDSKRERCSVHPPGRSKSGIETCLDDNQYRNSTLSCSALKSCSSCVATSLDCVWCSNPEAKAASPRAGGSGEKSYCAWQSCRSNLTKKFRRAEECVENGLEATPADWCPDLLSCHICQSKEGCSWRAEKVSKCSATQKKSGVKAQSGGGGGGLKAALEGGAGGTRGSASDGGANLTDEPGHGCMEACSERSSCTNCTMGLCMWCKNLNMCVDRNAYLASFPYGQCMEWTTNLEECPDPSKNASMSDNVCAGYKTCSSCRSHPSCGWCDDGSLTGLGSCYLGGAAHPLKPAGGALRAHPLSYVPAPELCPVSDGKTWHFTSCPSCQCNGHSTCSGEDKAACDQPCQDFTTGEHCEKCSKGYYGDAVNGGACQACQCNGQATNCNHKTGKCFCTTKGIIGDHCETCDQVNHYYGNPAKDSCFYDLAIDYQFTFNLSKSDDKHFTAINFKNDPTKHDVDVDFSISCSVPAKMNLTYRHTSHNGKESREEVLSSEVNCTLFKERFSKDDYSFGDKANTTFYVYVYDFEPPLWIVISFSQHPKLDLLQFFITFSTCFLALLLVAAILWKIKQRYDRFRRRQRLFVEMEQMASRPFGSVIIELERIPELPKKEEKSSATRETLQPIVVSEKVAEKAVAGGGAVTSEVSTLAEDSETAIAAASSNNSSVVQATASVASSSGSGGGGGGNVVRKRKRRTFRPSPIALEPCEGNRAAVLSLIVRLPTGGRPYAPPGYTGIAVASALVTLGNQRKPSADNTSNPKSAEDPKRKRKSHNSHPADI